MSRLVVSAPAKINLHLEIVGRRPDGYHELRTLLQSIDLADEVVVEPGPDGRVELEIEPPGAVAAADNLVVRAVRVVWETIGERPGARLRLVKRIPVGGGLGGGSADAAATLVVLDQMWSLGLDRATMLRLAASLGSDVPFFLLGGLVLGVGRGDEVYPLDDLGELGVVVVVPEVSISTPEVYHRLQRRLTWASPDASVYSLAAGLTTEVPWNSFRNDLQPVVVDGWPQVAAVLSSLGEWRPLHVAVTGSGSACYAVFEERARAEAVARDLAGRWRSHAGTTLCRERALLLEKRV